MTRRDDQESQTFIPSDGRRIGFAGFGDLQGTPILCNHGTTSCHLEHRYWEPAAKKLKARLIAPDRPGLGLHALSRAQVVGLAQRRGGADAASQAGPLSRTRWLRWRTICPGLRERTAILADHKCKCMGGRTRDAPTRQ
ncbi:hypothetical protein RBB50_004567 [Rhinocladiella similis]